MANGPIGAVIQHYRTLGAKDRAHTLCDRHLLERFVTGRDETAFEVLLARHGSMVMDVCRRVLHDRTSAEDAFQATFLVLARRAGSISKGELLANWLYGVAYRTAARARVEAAKRLARERAAPVRNPSDSLSEIAVRELYSVLDEELNKLSSRYRAPLVLCYLEARTRDEAAQLVGCSMSTLDRLLERGRRLLRTRLSRRGMASVLLPLLLSQGTATAGVRATLIGKTARAASSIVTAVAKEKIVLPISTTASTSVTALAEEVMRAMFVTKLKLAVGLVLLLGLVAAGTIFLQERQEAKQPTPGQSPRLNVSSNPEAPKVKARGEPKPRVLKIEGGVLFRMSWSPDAKGIVGVGMSQEREEQEVGGMKQTVTTFNSTVQLWNAETGQMKKSLGEEKKVRIGSVAIAPNGSLIAILAELPWEGRTSPCEVRLVDASTGTLKKTIEVDGLARVVAFSPDGRSLAIGGQYIPTKLDGPFERTIRIWDLEKEKVTQEFKQELEAKEVIETGYLDGLRDLAYSHNGKVLASADADWKVRLLNAEAGKVLQTLAGHTSVVTALAFSPDGKTLVTAGFDETVRIWDIVTGKELRTLEGTKGRVATVAFSPDGKLLVTGGLAGKGGKGGSAIILWDTNTWEPKKELPAEPGWVSSVAFSPGDGKTLAVGTNQIKLWLVRDLLSGDK